MERPTLYFDLGSPYAYLAVERAEDVLAVKPVFAPVLLGAIFQQRGWGSWALTDARAEGIAEIERRAAAYGLPPLVWPEHWPMNGLQAMRAAVWADEQGAVEAFAKAAFRRQFAAGEDISTPDALADIAREVDLDGDVLREAIRTDAVKERLKQATAEAWERGVRGVPTVIAGGQVFFGDDRLEEVS
jgi:2-hydroxychromene-2-carboxylate isomerase